MHFTLTKRSAGVKQKIAKWRCHRYIQQILFAYIMTTTAAAPENAMLVFISGLKFLDQMPLLRQAMEMYRARTMNKIHSPAM